MNHSEEEKERPAFQPWLVRAMLLATMGFLLVGASALTGSATRVSSQAFNGDTAAVLTIKKICVPVNDPGKFDILIDGQSIKEIGCGQSITGIPLAAGSYEISEEAGTGTSLDDYAAPVFGGDCPGGTVSVDQELTTSSTIPVPPEELECTITNTRVEQTATLTIMKECIGTDDGTVFAIALSSRGSSRYECGQSRQFEVEAGVEYTVSEAPPAGWEGPNIRGACDGDGTVTLEADETGTCVVQNVAEEQTATLFIEKECIGTDDGTVFPINVSGGIGTVNLECGETSAPITVDADTVYTVSETPPAGWTGPNIRGLCDGDGTFSLDPDDEGTCVVQNVAEEQTATLVIVKECIGTDNGTEFTINISGGIGPALLECGESDQFEVEAGVEYTVSETPPAGWTGPNIRGACDGDGTVTLEADETGTCVVQNVAEDQTATLIVTKECIGTDDGTLFTISVSTFGSDSYSCGDSQEFELEAGVEYTVSETPEDGWDGPNIRGACDGDGTVTLDPDETGTCVVQNVAEELASVSASKACNPDADPEATFTFTLYDASDDSVVDTATVSCGDIASFEGLEDGEYYVLESTVDGFDQDATNCGDAGTPILVDPDEDASCTITNIEVEGAPPASVVETSETTVVIVEAQPPAAPVEQAPVAEVQSVTQVITPPNTGDGGLTDSEHGRGFMTQLLMLAGVSGLVTALSVRRLRHLKRR